MTTKGHRWVRICLLLAVFLGLKSPVLANEQNPLTVIQTGTEQILYLFKQCSGSQNYKNGRFKDEVVQIVSNYFDFEEMSRRALSAHWQKQSSEKQAEFVRLFRSLFYRTYLDRIDGSAYSNEEVAFDTEQVEGDHALVKTRLIGRSIANVHIDYRLHQINQQWKVYDVVIEGVSFINNYRSQFNSLLARESFDALLNRLQDKVSTS